jgi:hypothetical protein
LSAARRNLMVLSFGIPTPLQPLIADEVEAQSRSANWSLSLISSFNI